MVGQDSNAEPMRKLKEVALEEGKHDAGECGLQSRLGGENTSGLSGKQTIVLS